MSLFRLFAALVALAAMAAAQGASETRCRVTQVSADGFYLDAGAEGGIAVDDTGILRHPGAEPVEIRIVAVSGSSARARLVAPATFSPEPGDTVIVSIRGVAPPPPADPPPTEDTQGAKGEFVPLLDRQKERNVQPAARPRNISHGWVGLRQLLHYDGATDFDYSTTLLGLRGSLSRIAGSDWMLRWNGSAQYRTGEAFQDSTLEGGKVFVYELSVSKTFESGGFLRFGRLLPAGLRVGGYLDGAQVEARLSGSFRVGGLAGLRPDRNDLAPSSDEPTVLPYFTMDFGTRGGSWFSGTAGLLGAWFSGEFDRLALLSQLHYENGRAFRLDSTIDFDFDVGAGEFKSGGQLTLFDLVASGDISPAFAWRAGAHRFERLDNRAERDRAPFADAELFLDEFWRTWIGARARLGDRWSIDGEVAAIFDGSDETTLHWRVRTTHFRPFGAPGANLALTIYNLQGANDTEGLGARLDGFFPLVGNRWNIQPSLGLRGLEALAQDFEVVDARLRVERNFGRGWSAHVDVNYATGTELDSLLLELGLNFRW